MNLPSFVRRTKRTSELKALIAEIGATLNRSGRSRNWSLNISEDQVKALTDRIYKEDESTWMWLIKAMNGTAQLTEVTHSISDLVTLIKQKQDITVSELMSLTNCTSLQARKALDQVEWSSDDD